MRLCKVQAPVDCIRIREQLWKLGYDCTLRDAEDLWLALSSNCASSWMCLPKDEAELLRYILCALEDKTPYE